MIYNEENEITISHQSSLSTYTVNKVSHESTFVYSHQVFLNTADVQ